MGTIAKKTPFFAWHSAHGATFAHKGGWVRPARYEGAAAEHLAVRAVGGIIDVHSMGKVTVEGAGATELLGYAATNDIAGLKVGGARYTCFCAPDGGIVDDVIVYRTGSERYYLITNTLSRERVLGFLRGMPYSGPSVVDVTSATAYIAVQGPRSRELLRDAGVAADLDADTLAYFECTPTEVAGVPVLLARTGYTGELGYELNFPAEYATDVWAHLHEVGGPMGFVPVGGEAMMTLRLEKGLRSYGSDIDTGVDPLEAGLGWVIDWSKPDFSGRAALARIREHGPARRAVYLLGEPGTAFEPGTVLTDVRGTPKGRVTSGLYGPSLEAHVGLALVDRAVEVSELLIAGGDEGGAVRCARRPFFDPEGTRVRS